MFFSIRSLEITNTLECGFSPFPSLFDLVSRRNNIFFFCNRSCVSQYIGTSVKCTGLLQNNIFFWKGNRAESFLQCMANHAMTGQEFVLFFTRFLLSSAGWRPFSMLPFDGSVGYSIPTPLPQHRQPSTPALIQPPFTASLTTKSPVPPPDPCPPSAPTRTMLPASPGTLWGTSPPSHSPLHYSWDLLLPLWTPGFTHSRGQTLPWAGAATPPSSISAASLGCNSCSLLLNLQACCKQRGKAGKRGDRQRVLLWLLAPSPGRHFLAPARTWGPRCSMRQQRAPLWVAWRAHHLHRHPSPQPHAHRPPRARVKHLPWLHPSFRTHVSSPLSSCPWGSLFPEPNGRKK